MKQQVRQIAAEYVDRESTIALSILLSWLLIFAAVLEYLPRIS